MILTCPSCGTQYVVKDGAIPPSGRQVRCKACQHSWREFPPPAAEPEEPSAKDGALSPGEEQFPEPEEQAVPETVEKQNSFRGEAYEEATPEQAVSEY